MRSILKATAALGSASLISILTGLISAKVSAVLLGPAGLGYMSLLQGLIGFVCLIVSMGVGTGLVRSGARAIALDDDRQMAALRKAAWALCWILSGLGAISLLLFRSPISNLALGSANYSGVIVPTAGMVILTVANGIQNSILNAHHRVGDLARVGVVSSTVGVFFSILIIWIWRERGIPLAVFTTVTINWGISYIYMRRSTPARPLPVHRNEVWSASRTLLRFGAPYTASMLVGAGVVMSMPIFVLHALGTENVGFYRAATAVSVNYLGFLIAAMGQDYYPRVSAVGDQADALRQLINQQHNLILLIAGPIILTMLALVPYLVPIVYSAQFTPAVALLEWQLIGDVFKFAAWSMAFVVLARSGSLVFFCLELIGGSSLLVLSWFGMRWLGLEGLGIAFLGCSVIYYFVSWTLLRRAIGLRWSRKNVILFWSLILAAGIIRGLPYAGLGYARTPVALILAAAAGMFSAYAIGQGMGGLKGLRAWRNPA